MSDKTALEEARGIVFEAQHYGRHEQTRHDAKEWMDAHGGGRCQCNRCVKDEAGFQDNIRRYTKPRATPRNT